MANQQNLFLITKSSWYIVLKVYSDDDDDAREVKLKSILYNFLQQKKSETHLPILYNSFGFYFFVVTSKKSASYTKCIKPVRTPTIVPQTHLRLRSIPHNTATILTKANPFSPTADNYNYIEGRLEVVIACCASLRMKFINYRWYLQEQKGTSSFSPSSLLLLHKIKSIGIALSEKQKRMNERCSVSSLNSHDTPKPFAQWNFPLPKPCRLVKTICTTGASLRNVILSSRMSTLRGPFSVCPNKEIPLVDHPQTLYQQHMNVCCWMTFF